MKAVTHDGRSAGLGWAVVSASSFALSGPVGRALMDAGWSAGAAVTVRLLLGAAVLLPLAARQLRGRWAVLGRRLPLVVAYGLVAVAGCQLAYFNAVARLPVSVALMIEYTAPVAVVAWMWLRHGHRPGRATLLGAALGVAGLALVLDVAAGVTADPVGVLWALAAMAGVACYFVLSADDDADLPGIVLAAAGLVVGGISLLIAGLIGLVPLTVTAAPVTLAGAALPWWLPVVGLGVFSGALAYVSGIAAVRGLGSRLASFAGLLEVVAAVTFAWLLLGQTPTAVQLVGGALILAGIATIRRGETDADQAGSETDRDGRIVVEVPVRDGRARRPR